MFPTRLHVDGLRRHAGAHAIMVADSYSVELAAFKVGYPAASIRGAAAEESLIFIHDGGSVGVHCGLATPWNQSLIGCTVQGGHDMIRWASSWSGEKGQLSIRVKQDTVLIDFGHLEIKHLNHEIQQLEIQIFKTALCCVYLVCFNWRITPPVTAISFWDLQIWKFVSRNVVT